MDELNRRTSQSGALPAQQKSKASTRLLSSLLPNGSATTGKATKIANTRKPKLSLWDRMSIQKHSHIDAFFARRDDKHASTSPLPSQIMRHEMSYRSLRASIKEDLTQDRLAQLEAKQNGTTAVKPDWAAMQAASSSERAVEMRQSQLEEGWRPPAAEADPMETFDKILSGSWAGKKIRRQRRSCWHGGGNLAPASANMVLGFKASSRQADASASRTTGP